MDSFFQKVFLIYAYLRYYVRLVEKTIKRLIVFLKEKFLLFKEALYNFYKKIYNYCFKLKSYFQNANIKDVIINLFCILIILFFCFLLTLSMYYVITLPLSLFKFIFFKFFV